MLASSRPTPGESLIKYVLIQAERPNNHLFVAQLKNSPSVKGEGEIFSFAYSGHSKPFPE
jgi:hypothetical protein